MKSILTLASMLFLISSCSESNEHILEKVSRNLSEIETVRYSSVIEVLDYGNMIHNDTSSFYFDFRDNSPYNLKYYLNSSHGELIYNGLKTFQSINPEKIITTSDDNNPEIVNNPLFLTLYPLRQILPKLLQEEEVNILIKNDTIINENSCVTFSFSLKNKVIDWINADIKEGEGDTEYILFVNAENNLPYKLVTPNGKEGLISRTFEDFEFEIDYSQEFWEGRTLPKDFAIFTEEEYFDNRKNNVLDNLGESVSDWELPELNNENRVKPSKLKGKVILLEFWFKGCGGCLSAIPSLNKIQARFGEEEFKIFGIEYLEEYPKEVLQKYIEEQNIQFPNLYKGKTVATNYGIRSAPTFLIIDKNGKIIHVKFGFSQENMNEIIEVIEKNI